TDVVTDLLPKLVGFVAINTVVSVLSLKLGRVRTEEQPGGSACPSTTKQFSVPVELSPKVFAAY
ncbi:hypothetical protein ABZX73_17525, partial [Brevibacterium casei]